MKHWPFPLREFQKQAINALTEPAASPSHILCIAPTGSGKSLIFEHAIRILGLRTLLVSPLVALARQHAERLRSAGTDVALYAGGERQLPKKKSQAWILSPESLFKPGSRIPGTLALWKPQLLVVDECHSIWDWGDGFRPAFAKLPEFAKESKIARTLWLTATMPEPARHLLREQLGALREIGEFGLPPRLHLQILKVAWPDRAEALVHHAQARAKDAGESGIVFVSTRDGAESVARLLIAAGISAIHYHAGLSREERQAIETAAEQGRATVIVATSAFGMGMDFRSLRWTIIWQAPHSVLQLTQAIGRVGRSHEAGRALVFWDTEDFRMNEWAIQASERRRLELAEIAEFLSGHGCRCRRLAEYFHRVGPPLQDCRISCDHCLRIHG